MQSTATDSYGRYQFLNAPGLDNNHLYYVRWAATASSQCATRLNAYVSSSIITGTYAVTGTVYHHEDFDVAPFAQLVPAASATVDTPVLFQWNPRTLDPSLPPEDFTLNVFDPANGPTTYETANLGPTPSYELATGELPATFVAPGAYGWRNISYYNIGSDGAFAYTCFQPVSFNTVAPSGGRNAPTVSPVTGPTNAKLADMDAPLVYAP